jgi:hypothetical protein
MSFYQFPRPFLEKCTKGFLAQKLKANKEEAPQCYESNSHPPIISPDTSEMAQAELLCRRNSPTAMCKLAHLRAADFLRRRWRQHLAERQPSSAALAERDAEIARLRAMLGEGK